MIREFRAMHWARAGIKDRTSAWSQIVEHFDDLAPCEHQHTNTTCSVVVVARVIDCRRQYNVCAVSARIHEQQMGITPTRVCRACGRPVSVCWKVRPV